MNVDIAEALKHARYNEVVLLKVADGEDSREMILVANLDEENGGIVWNNIPVDSGSSSSDSDVADPDFDGLMRHIRTKRWIFPMLNDHRRNQLYDEAIRAASQRVVAQQIACMENGEEHHEGPDIPTSILSPRKTIDVLDIGSGTGLLAMMAASHLEEAVNKSKLINNNSVQIQVRSLEMSSAMAKLAKRTVVSNSLENKVSILEGHSREVSLDQKAYFCTSELLESGFFGEGLLPALRDAWTRHLHKNAVIVPQRARIFAQVIEGQNIFQYWGPHQWLDDFPEGRVLRLCTSADDTDVLLGGDGGDTTSGVANAGVRVPLHAGSLCDDESSEEGVRFLSDPIEVLELNLSSRESIPGPEGQSQTRQFIPTASGRTHGVLFWWELDLWDGLTYSTKLGREPWQDHWHQCLFVFTKPKDACTQLIAGQPATLTASHNDSYISFAVSDDLIQQNVSSDGGKEPPNKRRCSTVAEMSSLISPERAFQLNDVKRMQTIRQGIQTSLAKYGTKAVILDLSDFSLCAMMAALQGACCVTSLETSSGELPMTAARVAQVANGLPLKSEKSTNTFQIVNCHAEQLSLDVLGGMQANVVLAEPYYELFEGWHLQEALNYFYLVRSLKKRGLISEDSVCVPSHASIMGCAIESENLGQAYKSCDSLLCGFKHDVINEFGNKFNEYDISLPMWQYSYAQLTDSFEVAKIDYGTGEIVNNGTFVSSKFRRAGKCHGLLTWVDYGIPNERSNVVLSMKGRPHRQLVRMLSEPVVLNEDDIGNGATSFRCRVLLGDLAGPEDHQFELSIEKS